MPAELLARQGGSAPAFGDLRGRIQADIFAGLPGHFRRLGLAPDQLRDWQRDRLRRVLATAIQHSAFHARRLRGVDAARFELADLPSLPVMTKAQMMDHFDELISDRLLTREAAERALAATRAEPQPLPGGYLCMATGGSSGQRGIFAYDPAGVAECVSLIFRTRLAALGVATPAAGPVQVPEVTFAMVGASSAVHGTVFVPSMLAGSPVRFVSVPVTLPVTEIVGRLNQLQAQGLFGYPSMLARLAAEQQAGHLKITPRLVNCTAETLQPEFRAAISKAFGAPIFNTFASTEGLFGSSGPDDPAITLATDSCIVELVDADYQASATRNRLSQGPGHQSVQPPPATDQVRAERLVHPAAGRRGERAPAGQRGGAGRRHPALRRRGDPSAGAAVDLAGQPDVLDYQVRQTARGMAVQVLLERETSLAGLREQLRAALARAGLANPEVTVDAVAALPRNPETGKLRRVIPA